MKLPEILRILKEEPLLITPGAHASLLKLFEDHAAMTRAEFQAQREGTGACGEAVEVEQAEIIDGIMHIPIGGPIGQRLSSFEKGAGAVDVSDISKELDEAEGNSEVGAILLDIDSPGGMVSGTPELADKIATIEKPIYAFSNGTIASAAYWIAAATDGIFATKSAAIGSIGVYIPWLDLTDFYKKEGARVELFASGKYKGMGYPGTSLTKDQRALLQSRVDSIAKMFYDHVRMNRGDVEDETMQGQTFMGGESLSRNLIDDVVRSKADVITLLS